MRLVFESPSADVLNAADNLCVGRIEREPIVLEREKDRIAANLELHPDAVFPIIGAVAGTVGWPRRSRTPALGTCSPSARPDPARAAISTRCSRHVSPACRDDSTPDCIEKNVQFGPDRVHPHGARAIEHGRAVPVSDDVPQQILRAAQFVVRVPRSRELDPVSLGCKWRHDGPGDGGHGDWRGCLRRRGVPRVQIEHRPRLLARCLGLHNSRSRQLPHGAADVRHWLQTSDEFLNVRRAAMSRRVEQGLAVELRHVRRHIRAFVIAIEPSSSPRIRSRNRFEPSRVGSGAAMNGVPPFATAAGALTLTRLRAHVLRLRPARRHDPAIRPWARHAPGGPPQRSVERRRRLASHYACRGPGVRTRATAPSRFSESLQRIAFLTCPGGNSGPGRSCG